MKLTIVPYYKLNEWHHNISANMANQNQGHSMSSSDCRSPASPMSDNQPSDSAVSAVSRPQTRKLTPTSSNSSPPSPSYIDDNAAKAIVCPLVQNLIWMLLSLALLFVAFMILLNFVRERQKDTGSGHQLLQRNKHVYKDCSEPYRRKDVSKKVYTISVQASPILISCDMKSYGGGWMIFQRQRRGNVNFNRSYTDYAEGFGNVEGDYWLGTESMTKITSIRRHQLVVIVEANGKKLDARYHTFSVANVSLDYKMTIGGYDDSSTLDNSFLEFNGKILSTINHPDNNRRGDCAKYHNAGFWWANCGRANINGNLFKTGPEGVFYSNISKGITSTTIIVRATLI